MKRPIQGKYIVVSTAEEKAQAFVPSDLPPSPPVDWSPELRKRFDQAMFALGRLDSVAELLPDVSLFIYTYVRKEAVLSSMIEGTQSSLSDLLLFELKELPGAPVDDVKEVSNYVAALDHGLKRMKAGFPLSVRLIKEMHACLLKSGRGGNKTPGEFRRSQNWIGGTRPGNAVFVPPPPEQVAECMAALELFIHDKPESTPALLKAALVHVQFETIHPFLDGNGRLGRLLITLLLCNAGVLHSPMLYLSLYFKTHRQAYYDFLNRVRSDGDWEVWLTFFAEAIIVTAEQAVSTVHKLESLVDQDRKLIRSIGRAAGSALKLHHQLMIRPMTSARALQQATGLSHVTVNKSLEHLSALHITNEITGGARNRIFSYTEYINILNVGTEPLDKNH